MSTQVKYVGAEQMPANMNGLPLPAIRNAEDALSPEEVLKLRYIYRGFFVPPLAFDRALGEFEFVIDQQNFEVFLAGFACSKQPLPFLTDEQLSEISMAERKPIPKHNLDAISEAHVRQAARERANAKANTESPNKPARQVKANPNTPQLTRPSAGGVRQCALTFGGTEPPRAKAGSQILTGIDLGGGKITAGNWIAPTLLQNDWVKQLRGNLSKRMYDLLQQRTSADTAAALVPDLDLNIELFLKDFDRELATRSRGL